MQTTEITLKVKSVQSMFNSYMDEVILVAGSPQTLILDEDNFLQECAAYCIEVFGQKRDFFFKNATLPHMLSQYCAERDIRLSIHKELERTKK